MQAHWSHSPALVAPHAERELVDPMTLVDEARNA
jgi:hypothetical protein